MTASLRSLDPTDPENNDSDEDDVYWLILSHGLNGHDSEIIGSEVTESNLKGLLYSPWRSVHLSNYVW